MSEQEAQTHSALDPTAIAPPRGVVDLLVAGQNRPIQTGMVRMASDSLADCALVRLEG